MVNGDSQAFRTSGDALIRQWTKEEKETAVDHFIVIVIVTPYMKNFSS